MPKFPTNDPDYRIIRRGPSRYLLLYFYPGSGDRPARHVRRHLASLSDDVLPFHAPLCAAAHDHSSRCLPLPAKARTILLSASPVHNQCGKIRTSRNPHILNS
jgi:hypothetical protein